MARYAFAQSENLVEDSANSWNVCRKNLGHAHHCGSGLERLCITGGGCGTAECAYYNQQWPWAAASVRMVVSQAIAEKRAEHQMKKWIRVIWDDTPGGNVEHVEEHDLTTDDIDYVLENYL